MTKRVNKKNYGQKRQIISTGKVKTMHEAQRRGENTATAWGKKEDEGR